MSEKPILFSAPMVRAILAGEKTQTRRVVNLKPQGFDTMQPAPEATWVRNENGTWAWWGQVGEDGRALLYQWGVKSAYEVGDRLWVRENLHRPDGDPWLYSADDQHVEVSRDDETAMLVWAHHKEQDYCPSIHMPRWASRITLEVTNVRCQRLWEISEDDARAEGIQVLPLQSADDPSAWWQSAPGEHQERTPRASFAQLWISINGKRPGCSWADNPWVFAYTFQRTV